MTDKKQEPCPCCGSSDVRWVTQWEAAGSPAQWVADRNSGRVHCFHCGIQTEVSRSRRQAEERWNRRTPSPAREDLARAEIFKAGVLFALEQQRMLNHWAEADATLKTELWQGLHREGERFWKLLTDINEGRHPALRASPPSKSEDEVRAEVWEEAAIEAEQERAVFLDVEGLAHWEDVARIRKQMRSEVAKACRDRAKALRAGKREEGA